MKVCMFNFYNYFENPVVKYCIDAYKQMGIDLDIRTLEDCKDDIVKLTHANNCFESGLRSQIGDQLRLYYASISDDFIYVDCDSIVYDLDKLKMDRACPYGKTVNEGSYFRANKNTAWVNYYLNKYEESAEYRYKNTVLFKKYPYTIPKQILHNDHFYVSHFYKLQVTDTIYYTRNYKKRKSIKAPVLLITGLSPSITGDNLIYVSDKLPLELIKEQCNFAQGRELIFKEL